MAAQSGKDLLVKIDMDGAGTFDTVAGLRTSRIALNSETLDTTNMTSAGGWRELLSGGGMKTATISGSGVFCDQASDERVRQVFFDGLTPDFQVIVPDFGALEGAFQISSLEYAGDYNGEATFEMTLASAGQISFSPAI